MIRRSVKRDDEGWLIEYDERPVWKLSDLRKARKTDKPMYTINLKGCNGSGKSTIPLQLIAQDSQWVFLTTKVDDKKPVGTILPQMRIIILGTYLTACGGCDSLSDTKRVQELLKDLWTKDFHILFEGVIVGDIRSTFYELMKSFRDIWPREVEFCFMGTRLGECLRRIQRRNGGKPINEELVKQKYQNSLTQITYYAEQGDVGVSVLDTTGTKSQIIARFLFMYTDLGPVF